VIRLASFALAALAAGAASCNGPRSAPEAKTTSGETPADARAAASESVPPAKATPAQSLPSIDAAAERPRDFEVPRARAPISPTGHFRIELWDGAPSTGTLLDREGRGAVPVSESRFLWGNGALYLFYYAGDLDLEARIDKHDGPIWEDDSVELAFAGASEDGAAPSKRVIRISVKGVVSDGLCPADAADLSDPRCDLRWESGTRAATDFDGTLNSIADRDEEWAVEAAIPLESLGATRTPGTRIPLRMSRCEIAHDGPRACGAWEGTLVLGSEPAARTSGHDR
jgi:hypothetical protein